MISRPPDRTHDERFDHGYALRRAWEWMTAPFRFVFWAFACVGCAVGVHKLRATRVCLPPYRDVTLTAAWCCNYCHSIWYDARAEPFADDHAAPPDDLII